MTKKKQRFLEEKRIPFINTPPASDLAWTLILVPLWWVLGLRFIVFHMLAVVIAAKTFFRKRALNQKMVFPAESGWLLGYAGVYLLSLAVNGENIPFSRMLASLNNLSYWILGWVIIWIVANNISREGVLSWLRSARVLGLASGLFVIAAMACGLFVNRDLKIQSILGAVLPDNLIQIISEKAPLLHHSLSPHIVAPTLIFRNWVPRPVGFNVYGTALAVSMLILMVLTWAGYKMTGKKRGKGIVLSLEAAALILSFSRIAVLSFILAGAAVFLLVHHKKRAVRMGMVLFCLLLMVFIIVYSPQKIWKTASEFRRGSTIFRMRLYKLTFEEALKKPVLGHGHKPRPEDLPVPVGSHSMYMGVLYKTGFAGLAVFLLFWAAVFRRWRLRRRSEDGEYSGPLWAASGTAFIGGLVWMLTEDLDAPPVAAVLFFLVVGLILAGRYERGDSKKT